MGKEGQIDVNKCVRYREPLPCRCYTAIAIDNPLISTEDFSMGFKVLLIRDLATGLLLRPISAFSELDYIEYIQR